MRVALLLEPLHPRPWSPDGDAGRVRGALNLAIAADAQGLDGVWLPERHFQEELHHGGPPEALAGAILARTRRLTVGLGPMPLHPALQHPARLAASVAALDRLGGGRTALAAAVPRAGIEVVALRTPRAAMVEAAERQLRELARMLAEEPYAGAGPATAPAGGTPRWIADALPPRQVVPRPATAPHPPFWWTCERPEHVRDAARHGLGALVRAPLEPEEAAAWVIEHERGLAAGDAVALGARADAGVAVCLPLHVGATPASAVAEGLDAVHLHRHLVDHYERLGAHRPGRAGASATFAQRRSLTGLGAEAAATRPDGPLSLRRDGALRGAVGDARQVEDLLAAYRDAGVAEVVLVPPLGALPDELVHASLERLATGVLRALQDDDVVTGAPSGRSTALAAVLARRPVAPAAPETLVLAREDASPGPTHPGAGRDPTVEGAAAAGRAGGNGAAVGIPATGGAGAPASTIADGVVRGLLARAGVVALETALHHRGPRVVRTALAGEPTRRLLLAAMARGLRPAATAGRLRGELQLDLRDRAAVRHYTLEALPGGASSRVGPARDPRLVLGLTAEDLLRLAAGRLDPARALVQGRLELRGDLGLALALGEVLRAG